MSDQKHVFIDPNTNVVLGYAVVDTEIGQAFPPPGGVDVLVPLDTVVGLGWIYNGDPDNPVFTPA